MLAASAPAVVVDSPRRSVPAEECFSRDDERRLDALKRRQQQQQQQSSAPGTDLPHDASDGGEESSPVAEVTLDVQTKSEGANVPSSANNSDCLTAAELSEVAALESKYQLFLDEGVRRLQSADASRGNALQSPSHRRENDASPAADPTAVGAATQETPSSSWTDGVVSAASQLGRAAYFWGSLVGTAVPAVAKKIGITDHFDHWNFITDRLILGALPVMTQVGSFGNHLAQLRHQLDERHQALGLVVACLGMEEMTGFGVQVLEFAREEHWHAHISPAVEYVYLPMHDGTADVTMEHVRMAVDRLHEVLDKKKECAYVHCKAGKGRSWMVTVCYLATYGGRTFENAEAMVYMARHQVNPSRSQREFARDFCKKFHGDELARKLMQDDVEPE